MRPYKIMNILFVHQNPHKCHEIWAKNINAEFVHFKEMPKITKKYDVLLIEGGAPLWNGWKYKKNYPKTKLIYLNADETPLIWKKLLLKMPFHIAKWRFCINKVDGVISVSNLVSIRRTLKLEIPEKIVRPFIKHKYNYPKYNPENLNIVTVGYYHPRQGIDILLKAFWILKNKFNNLKLYLVGKGYPQKLAKNGVIVTGFVENLEEIYKIAGLYVHAGRYQAFPVAPLEAMHYGIPSIVTNMTGICEILKHELVAECNSKSLAERIEWFLNLDLNEKKKYSKYCYKKSLEFLERNSIRKFRDAFFQLI